MMVSYLRTIVSMGTIFNHSMWDIYDWEISRACVSMLNTNMLQTRF